MNLNLLFITFNILTLISDILFITTNYNCSYQHINIFNEFVDKFDKDCWACMFNVECIVKPSILNVTLHIDTISKTVTKREGPYTTALDDRTPDVDLSDPDLLTQT
jgi:hypothetical protein